MFNVSVQLTTGASGGAILKPSLRIPAKLVKREPCLKATDKKNSIVLKVSKVQRTKVTFDVLGRESFPFRFVVRFQRSVRFPFCIVDESARVSIEDIDR